MKNLFKLISAGLILSLFWNCTENPFFKDKEIKGNSIQGRVVLKDQTTPSDVYIWLEDWNVGTFSDENGAFHLSLPSSPQVGSAGNGLAKLYFYVNNYYLDSSQVLMVNGNVSYGEADINDNGELKQVKQLSKLLDIDVAVSPEIVSANYKGKIEFKVTLTAHPDSVRICTKIVTPDTLASGFILNTDADAETARQIDFHGKIYTKIPIYREYLLPNYKRQLTMRVDFPALNLSAGEYQFIPFLFCTEQQVPSTLPRILGQNIISFHPDFLNMPMKRKGGIFKVVAGN